MCYESASSARTSDRALNLFLIYTEQNLLTPAKQTASLSRTDALININRQVVVVGDLIAMQSILHGIAVAQTQTANALETADNSNLVIDASMDPIHYSPSDQRDVLDTVVLQKMTIQHHTQ